ncbi:hypothetical protein SteCoe_23888 [Stentor coeruleus]|uniref:Uncharacterized protein n=1 Tax=Stentor coeruleus TaxID=5963 RepID=A0A1R2BIX2_9CILI|nr:hypothetical protein SteCoe_23888 [Stentor coeruleus]
MQSPLLPKFLPSPQVSPQPSSKILQSIEPKSDNALTQLRNAWNYIQIEPKLNLPNSFVTTLNYHTKSVNCVAFSPDGKYLASGSEDCQVKIWDLVEKKEHCAPIQDTENIISINFSPNEKLLAISCGNQVKIWSFIDNKVINVLKCHSDDVVCVRFSPDGKLLASASLDSYIKLWYLDKKKPKQIYSGHEDKVYCISFSPDGKYLASGSEDCLVKIWDVNRKDKEINLDGHEEAVLCVVFSPDGKFIASGSEDDLIIVWNFAEKTEEFTLKGHTSTVYSLSFSSDGKFLASGSEDSLVKIWNLEEESEQCTLTGHSIIVCSVCFSPNGKILASGSADSSVKLWKVHDDKEKMCIKSHSQSILCLNFSPDGQLLATGSKDFLVKIFDIKNSIEKGTLKGHTAKVMCVAFTPDGKQLASGSKDKIIIIWDVGEMKEVFRLEDNKAFVNCLCFSLNGEILACGLESHIVKVWDFIMKKEAFVLTGHSSGVYSVVFSPDGRFLASGSEDYLIKIWNILDNKEEYTLAGHTDLVYCVCFSPDSRFLASGSYDCLVKVWNLQKKKEECTLDEHLDLVWSVSFSPDGKFLASASEDKLIKIWNVNEKKEEFTIDGHNNPVGCVRFSPDGKIIASGSKDGVVKLWDFSDMAKEYTKSSNQKVVESIELSLDYKAVLVKYNSEIKAFSIASGDEIDPNNFIPLTPNNQKLFDPLSCINIGYQNYLKTIQNYFYLSTKSFSKLNYINTTLTNLKFSIAHFLSMLGHESIIEKSIISKNLIITPDAFGHGPAYYSIKCKHQKITDKIIEYISETVENSKLGFNTFTFLKTLENDLPELLSSSSQFIDKLMSIALVPQESSAFFGNPLKTLPIEIINDYHLSKFEDFANNEGDTIPLIITQTPFRIPFCIGSPSSLYLINSILMCKNKDIYRTSLIHHIINHRWNEIIFWVYLYTFLLWGNIIIIFFLISTNSHLYCFITLLINLFLLIWECLQFRIIGKKYFYSPTNLLDLIRFYSTTIYSILKIFDIEYTLLTWSMIAFNLLRGFSGFRAFDNTRYYVKLLKMCIYRMKDFLIIFAYATLSLGLMNSISANSNPFSYQALWSSPFGIIVGKTDNFNETNSIQVITYTLAVTTNMIIMLNMIISILGDVFDEFQLDAEILNYNEMAGVIMEIEQILSIRSKDEEFKYLHICMHAYEKNELEWKGKVIDVREFIRGKFLNNDIKPLFEECKRQIICTDEKLVLFEEKVTSVDEKIGGFDGKVKGVIESVKSIEKNFTSGVNKLSENVKEISGKIRDADEKVVANCGDIRDRMDNFEKRVGGIEDKIDSIQRSIEGILSILSK